MHTPVTTRSSGAPADAGSTTSSSALDAAPIAADSREQAARIDPVGEAEERAREAPDDEARLHAARQRRLGEARQVELGDERRDDRRGREPQRHRGDLADRDERDRCDLRRFRIGIARRSELTRGVRSSAA